MNNETTKIKSKPAFKILLLIGIAISIFLLVEWNNKINEEIKEKEELARVEKENKIKLEAKIEEEKNVRSEIISNAICANKLIYHEKMHVQNLIDKGKTSGNYEMVVSAQMKCLMEAYALKYFFNEIEDLRKKIGLNDDELSKLFEEAKILSFSELKALSTSTTELNMPSYKLTEMADVCTNKVDDKKRAELIAEEIKIIKNEIQGFTAKQICNKEIPGTF